MKTEETAPSRPTATPLARAIYRQLVEQLRVGQTSTTYGELARAVGAHPRSGTLHAALGEVTEACRARGLPILPAIVWGARSFQGQLAAWKHEHARVIAADHTSWPSSS